MANWLKGGRKISNLILIKEYIIPEWKPILREIFNDKVFKKAFKEFCDEVRYCGLNGIDIFPNADDVFNIFYKTKVDFKAVLLGQDPYIGEINLLSGPNGTSRRIPQAHGFSFSVPVGAQPPPSLKNIFKELQHEYPSFQLPKDGNLLRWVNEGVLLLNSALTVRSGKSNSHKQFWEYFTDKLIEIINRKYMGIVFILLGNEAQKKEYLVSKNNFVIKAGHPSPLNSKNDFIGSNCFKQCNKYLKSIGIKPIAW